MIVTIEAQLLRDWQPRTRPVVGEVTVGGILPVCIKTFPGAAGDAQEDVCIWIEGTSRSDPDWMVGRVSVTIDAVMLSSPQPFMLFLHPHTVPSGIAHFPVMALQSNKKFGGRHSVLMKVVKRA